MTWCLQCGIEHRNVPALGTDEDGEPACQGHMKAAVRPQQNSQPETSEPMKKAKKKCPGFERECQEMIGLGKELCSRCYTRRSYRSHRPRKNTALPDPRPARKTNGYRRSGHAPSGLIRELAALKAKLLAEIQAIEDVERLLEKAR